MQRGSIVTVESAHIIRTVNGNKEVEFAEVKEFVQCDGERQRIHGDDGRRDDCNEKGNRLREGGVKSWLRVQKIKGAVEGGTGCFGGCEYRSHVWGKNGLDKGNSSGAENEYLQLECSEKGETRGVVVGKNVGSVCGA